MQNFPMKFTARGETPEKIKTTWSVSASNTPPLTCAIPKEFGGNGDGYSPEDLFGLAVMTCFMASFKVFAEKSNLEFTNLKGEVEIILDHNEEKTIAITETNLHFTLTGATDKEKAQKLLEEAKRNCIVANSIKSKNNFNFTLN